MLYFRYALNILHFRNITNNQKCQSFTNRLRDADDGGTWSPPTNPVAGLSTTSKTSAAHQHQRFKKTGKLVKSVACTLNQQLIKFRLL